MDWTTLLKLDLKEKGGTEKKKAKRRSSKCSDTVRDDSETSDFITDQIDYDIEDPLATGVGKKKSKSSEVRDKEKEKKKSKSGKKKKTEKSKESDKKQKKEKRKSVKSDDEDALEERESKTKSKKKKKEKSNEKKSFSDADKKKKTKKVMQRKQWTESETDTEHLQYTKIPDILPTSACKLKTLKLQRVNHFLLLEEEFIRGQEGDKSQASSRSQEVKQKLDELRVSPNFMEQSIFCSQLERVRKKASRPVDKKSYFSETETENYADEESVFEEERINSIERKTFFDREPSNAVTKTSVEDQNRNQTQFRVAVPSGKQVSKVTKTVKPIKAIKSGNDQALLIKKKDINPPPPTKSSTANKKTSGATRKGKKPKAKIYNTDSEMEFETDDTAINNKNYKPIATKKKKVHVEDKRKSKHRDYRHDDRKRLERDLSERSFLEKERLEEERKKIKHRKSSHYASNKYEKRVPKQEKSFSPLAIVADFMFNFPAMSKPSHRPRDYRKKTRKGKHSYYTSSTMRRSYPKDEIEARRRFEARLRHERYEDVKPYTYYEFKKEAKRRREKILRKIEDRKEKEKNKSEKKLESKREKEAFKKYEGTSKIRAGRSNSFDEGETKKKRSKSKGENPQGRSRDNAHRHASRHRSRE